MRFVTRRGLSRRQQRSIARRWKAMQLRHTGTIATHTPPAQRRARRRRRDQLARASRRRNR